MPTKQARRLAEEEGSARAIETAERSALAAEAAPLRRGFGEVHASGGMGFGDLGRLWHW
jgi:hypothetical protein